MAKCPDCVAYVEDSIETFPVFPQLKAIFHKSCHSRHIRKLAPFLVEVSSHIPPKTYEDLFNFVVQSFAQKFPTKPHLKEGKLFEDEYAIVYMNICKILCEHTTFYKGIRDAAILAMKSSCLLQRCASDFAYEVLWARYLEFFLRTFGEVHQTHKRHLVLTAPLCFVMTAATV